jgi:hypothetical protein
LVLGLQMVLHGSAPGQGPKQVPPQPSESPQFLPAQLGVQATVTVKLQLAVSPLSSVAVQVTAVAPTGNEEPEGWLQEICNSWSQLSVADTVKLTAAVDAPGAAATVIGSGHDGDGS